MSQTTNFPNKEITKTYLSGTHSCCLIIPKDIAKQYGLDNPSHVIVEGIEKGILIRRLDATKL
jgi:hypothetical protein